MCIQLLRFASWSYFRYRQSRTDWALEFGNFCIEFCKKLYHVLVKKRPENRTKAIRDVQSSWQTTQVTLIHTILTEIQSSFFQFLLSN